MTQIKQRAQELHVPDLALQCLGFASRHVVISMLAITCVMVIASAIASIHREETSNRVIRAPQVHNRSMKSKQAIKFVEAGGKSLVWSDAHGVIEHDGMTQEERRFGVTAGFRIDANSVEIENVAAHIVYYTKDARSLFSVDHVLWLEEEFNTVNLSVEDTKHVLIAFQDPDKSWYAIDDKRHGINKNLAAKFIPITTDMFNVEIELVASGFSASFTFAVEVGMSMADIAFIAKA